MFLDPRFATSGISTARLSVSWDALSSPWQTAEIDAWLDAARAAGVEPLVSFGHSRIDRRSLPTPERFLYEFRRFRARYPWVKEYATWNEANHCGEPTCHRPRLVAAYYRKLRRECPDCRILAAEVLDMPNMVRWVRAFRRAAGEEPRYWGLHNYLDANRRRTTGTRRMLRAVKGQVWFTETGGIVRRRNRRKVTFPESANHARLHLPLEHRRRALDVGLRADRADGPGAPGVPRRQARPARAGAPARGAGRPAAGAGARAGLTCCSPSSRTRTSRAAGGACRTPASSACAPRS
jgi:hypothetical protein